MEALRRTEEVKRQQVDAIRRSEEVKDQQVRAQQVEALRRAEEVKRQQDAEKLFKRLLALRNDLGLLAEEYEPRLARHQGNFPQAFSHVALVNSAFNLSRFNTGGGPTRHRSHA